MKFLLAALAATSIIAVTASVFAIWPAVADAPWEAANSFKELNCEAALDMRNDLVVTEAETVGGVERYDILFERSQELVAAYC